MTAGAACLQGTEQGGRRASSVSERAFTTDRPTPWRPPDTEYLSATKKHPRMSAKHIGALSASQIGPLLLSGTACLLQKAPSTRDDATRTRLRCSGSQRGGGRGRTGPSPGRIPSELAPGVQNGEHSFQRALSGPGVQVCGDAAAIVHDAHPSGRTGGGVR